MKKLFVVFFVAPLLVVAQLQAYDAISAHDISQARPGPESDGDSEVARRAWFLEAFPPEDCAVISWYVMMGIGQIVILEVPASKLRDVNLALEKTAWKAFRTEFYPTYDLYPFIKDKLANPSMKP